MSQPQLAQLITFYSPKLFWSTIGTTLILLSGILQVTFSNNKNKTLVDCTEYMLGPFILLAGWSILTYSIITNESFIVSWKNNWNILAIVSSIMICLGSLSQFTDFSKKTKKYIKGISIASWIGLATAIAGKQNFEWSPVCLSLIGTIGIIASSHYIIPWQRKTKTVDYAGYPLLSLSWAMIAFGISWF
ncbi:MAG: hypothetical protein JSR17_00955 [Proteobacteria bacterium]|nr:hypothetical protein [Pseudomonadota bacterium]